MLNQICRSSFRSDKASVLNGLKNDLNLMRLLAKKFKNKPTRLSQDIIKAEFYVNLVGSLSPLNLWYGNDFVCVFFRESLRFFKDEYMRKTGPKCRRLIILLYICFENCLVIAICLNKTSRM